MPHPDTACSYTVHFWHWKESLYTAPPYSALPADGALSDRSLLHLLIIQNVVFWEWNSDAENSSARPPPPYLLPAAPSGPAAAAYPPALHSRKNFPLYFSHPSEPPAPAREFLPDPQGFLPSLQGYLPQASAGLPSASALPHIPGTSFHSSQSGHRDIAAAQLPAPPPMPPVPEPLHGKTAHHSSDMETAFPKNSNDTGVRSHEFQYTESGPVYFPQIPQNIPGTSAGPPSHSPPDGSAPARSAAAQTANPSGMISPPQKE